jgi:DNA polymerase-3 subunit gamma/tau
MSQALYRKWRPHRWEQVVGQEHVVQTLQNAVAAGRVAHAYLFAGPRGTGKTTAARLLAKAVNCLGDDLAERPCDGCEHCQAVNAGRFLDLIEIDAASNTSVEDVRSLRDKINFAPNQGRYKVYIVDEVHMLSTAAFNALLKTLEEPPPHAIFILATTEVHKIPATVASRCQRHEFRRLPVADIVAHLRKMAEGEGVQAEDEALNLIARQATGSLRDAISLLDQLAAAGQAVSLSTAQSLLGTVASQAVLDVVSALQAGDPAAGLDVIHRALDAGSDPRQFARQMVDYLRSLLLISMGSGNQVDATKEMRAQMARQAQGFSVPELLRVIRAFNGAAGEARSSWQPSLLLEMAFVEALTGPAQAEPVEAARPAQAPSRPATGAPRTAAQGPARKAEAAAEEDDRAQAGAGLQEGSEVEGEAESEALSLKRLADHWRKVLAVVHQRSPNTAALLRSGQILGIQNGTLFFGLSEVLRVKMDKSENLELIQAALQQVYGREIPFRCIAATGKGQKLPPDIDGDGMVAAALRDLGGEIVDIS